MKGSTVSGENEPATQVLLPNTWKFNTVCKKIIIENNGKCFKVLQNVNLYKTINLINLLLNKNRSGKID